VKKAKLNTLPSALEQEAQGLCRRDPILRAGREIAADAGEELCPQLRTEAAGDLLLNFAHAQIPFALIVGQGHVQFQHEAQHIVLELNQPIQSVSGFGAFQSTALAFFPL
jgi:hypothetical protein